MRQEKSGFWVRGGGREREGKKKRTHKKNSKKNEIGGKNIKSIKKKNETRFNEEYISSNLNRLSRF